MTNKQQQQQQQQQQQLQLQQIMKDKTRKKDNIDNDNTERKQQQNNRTNLTKQELLSYYFQTRRDGSHDEQQTEQIERNIFKTWGWSLSKTESQITQKSLELQGNQFFSYIQQKPKDQNKNKTTYQTSTKRSVITWEKEISGPDDDVPSMYLSTFFLPILVVPHIIVLSSSPFASSLCLLFFSCYCLFLWHSISLSSFSFFLFLLLSSIFTTTLLLGCVFLLPLLISFSPLFSSLPCSCSSLPTYHILLVFLLSSSPSSSSSSSSSSHLPLPLCPFRYVLLSHFTTTSFYGETIALCYRVQAIFWKSSFSAFQKQTFVNIDTQIFRGNQPITKGNKQPSNPYFYSVTWKLNF